MARTPKSALKYNIGQTKPRSPTLRWADILAKGQVTEGCVYVASVVCSVPGDKEML